MAKNTILALLLSPTAITIHNDGNMLRNLFLVDMIK
jgi:hypothetical protein